MLMRTVHAIAHHGSWFSCVRPMSLRIYYILHASSSCHCALNIICIRTFHAIAHRGLGFSCRRFMLMRIEYYDLYAYGSCHCAPNLIFMRTFHAILVVRMRMSHAMHCISWIRIFMRTVHVKAHRGQWFPCVRFMWLPIECYDLHAHGSCHCAVYLSCHGLRIAD